VAGLAAAGTGFGLAGTSYATASGVVVPDLHNAASDRPIAYTPACSRGGSAVPVCLHPAFASYLPALSTALDPLLSEVAGLPGAPARVTQATGPGQSHVKFVDGTISGSPPVLYLNVSVPIDTNSYSTADFTDPLQQEAALAIMQAVTGVDPAGGGSRAQQAVAAGLLNAAGVSLSYPGGPPGPGEHHPGEPSAVGAAEPAPGTPVYAAAQRFAALPAATRRAWLASHVAALRAGSVTLAQIP
jgi:hypothetical protein